MHGMNIDTANQLIDRIGGTSATARLCMVSPAAVSEWRRNGIPQARLMYLRLAVPGVFNQTVTAQPTPADS
jgi:hypothetical protein